MQRKSMSVLPENVPSIFSSIFSISQTLLSARLMIDHLPPLWRSPVS